MAASPENLTPEWLDDDPEGASTHDSPNEGLLTTEDERDEKDESTSRKQSRAALLTSISAIKKHAEEVWSNAAKSNNITDVIQHRLSQNRLSDGFLYYLKEQLQVHDYSEAAIKRFEQVHQSVKLINDARSSVPPKRRGDWLFTKDGVQDHPTKKRKVSEEKSKESGTSETQGISMDGETSEEPQLGEEGATDDNTGNEESEWIKPSGDYRPVMLTEEQQGALKETMKTPPRFLYRVSSWEGRKHTNGHDTIRLHLPAAHVHHNETCHDSLFDVPNGLSELVEMLGRRFLWQDRKRDETLSWTSSLLFALVHATGRLAKRQRHVVIHVIDTTKVTSINGKSVDFFFAPDLIRVLDVQAWHGWHFWDRVNLRQPFYTHEWITQGAVISPQAHSFEANIECLVSSRLYDYLEHLKPRDGEEMKSLYHRCRYTRSHYHRVHSGDQSVTMEEKVMVQGLARLFLSPGLRQHDSGCVPPLHVVLDFLSMKARPQADKVFMDWMRSDYESNDLLTMDYNRSLRVANNLPEEIQRLSLVRDACTALSTPKILPTRIWMVDSNFDWYGKWQKDFVAEIGRSRRDEVARRKKKDGPMNRDAAAIMQGGPAPAQAGQDLSGGDTNAQLPDGSDLNTLHAETQDLSEVADEVEDDSVDSSGEIETSEQDNESVEAGFASKAEHEVG